MLAGLFVGACGPEWSCEVNPLFEGCDSTGLVAKSFTFTSTDTVEAPVRGCGTAGFVFRSLISIDPVETALDGGNVGIVDI